MLFNLTGSWPISSHNELYSLGTWKLQSWWSIRWFEFFQIQVLVWKQFSSFLSHFQSWRILFFFFSFLRQLSDFLWWNKGCRWYQRLKVHKKYQNLSSNWRIFCKVFHRELFLRRIPVKTLHLICSFASFYFLSWLCHLRKNRVILIIMINFCIFIIKKVNWNYLFCHFALPMYPYNAMFNPM